MPDTTRPYIKNVTPLPNASGIAITSAVIVEFSENMKHTTITSTNIGLYKDPLTFVSTSINYNSTFNLATITPDDYLDVNTRYSVVVSGTVQDYYGNPMYSDYWWNFWTGTPSGYVYIPDEVTQPVETTLEGYMEVSSTIPKPYTSNIPLDSISPITIVLSDTCAIGSRNYFGDADDSDIPASFGESYFEDPDETIASYVTINNQEVLGNPAAIHTIPSYTVSVDDNIITIDGTGWVYSNEYLVTIKAGLPGLSSNPMVDDYKFVFTSAYSPLYVGASVIRLNIGPMLQMAMAYVPDDTLNRFIYEASTQAGRLYPLTLDPYDLPWYVEEFVIYQSKLNALYAAIMLFAGSGAGIRKTLADLTIEIDARGLMPALLPIIGDYRKLRDDLLDMVEAGSDSGPNPVWTIKSQYDTRRPITDTSWRRLPFRDVRADSTPDEYLSSAAMVYTIEAVESLFWLYTREGA